MSPCAAEGAVRDGPIVRVGSVVELPARFPPGLLDDRGDKGRRRVGLAKRRLVREQERWARPASVSAFIEKGNVRVAMRGGSRSDEAH